MIIIRLPLIINRIINTSAAVLNIIMADMAVDVAALLANNNIVATAPVALNGARGLVDLTSVVSFVSDTSIMAVNDVGIMNLRDTIQHTLWVAHGRPAGPTAMTQAGFTAAKNGLAIAYMRYSLFDLVSHTNITLSFRSGDCIDHVDANAGVGIASFGIAADRIHARMRSHPKFAARVTPAPKFALIALFANNAHRVVTAGHNWITNAAKGTPADKALGHAGAELHDFRTFMDEFGHDLWHVLSDASLKCLCDQLTSRTGERFVSQYVYNNTQVMDLRLMDVIRLPDSTLDRYPIGTIGISALVIGTSFITALFNDVLARVAAGGVSGALAGVDRLRTALGSIKLDRRDLEKIRSLLIPAIAIACGYVGSSVDGADEVAKHPSITALMLRNPSETSMGNVLGKYMRGKEFNDSGMTRQLNEALMRVAQGVADAMANFSIDTDGISVGVSFDRDAVALSVPVVAEEADEETINRIIASEVAAADATLGLGPVDAPVADAAAIAAADAADAAAPAAAAAPENNDGNGDD